ncbi:hypothetical protein S245_058102, partial [Arachis hypogaea]
DVEEGFGFRVTAEVAIDILVKSYGSSEIKNQVNNVVATITESNSGAVGKKRVNATFLTQCLVLMRRSSLRLFRDLSNYWLLLVVFIAVAISMGSMFYNIGSSNGSIQGRGSLLTFLISTLAFMALIGGFAPLMEEMRAYFDEFDYETRSCARKAACALALLCTQVRLSSWFWSKSMLDLLWSI